MYYYGGTRHSEMPITLWWIDVGLDSIVYHNIGQLGIMVIAVITIMRH